MKRSQIILLGTIIAQAITFATSFVITAFYNPEDLGLLGSLGALISVVAGTLCFRLEVAVIQADTDDSVDTFLKSTILGGLACTLFSVICFILPYDFATKISNYFVLFVFWCWGYCFFFNSKQLPFKFNELKYVSWGGIWRSLFTLVFQLIAGIKNPTFYSLLSGRVAGDYAGGLVHSFNYLKRMSLRRTFSHWLAFIKKHSDFIIYMAPHHLCLSLSNNIIIFYLERSYGLVIVGFYALAQRLIMAPIEVLGSTIANVTMQRFGELKDNLAELRRFYLKVILLSLAVSISAGIFIFGTVDFFIPLLGSKWADASFMVKSLVPFFISYLFSMPTTYFLRFINRAKLQLTLEIVELGIKVVLLSFYTWDDSSTMVLAYGIASFIFSLLRTGIVFKLISK